MFGARWLHLPVRPKLQGLFNVKGMNNLDYVVVLTGPTSGLGRAIYDKLRTFPIRRILVGRKLSRIAATQPTNKVGYDNRIEVDLGSLGRPDRAAKFSDTLETRLVEARPSRIVFINNAATITPIAQVGELRMEETIGAISVNLIAPMLIANVCTKVAARSSDLKIVNISSGAANRAISGWGVYCATKIACKRFFEVQEIEATAKVQHIDPGLLDTSMQKEIRASSPNNFPSVEYFINAADSGKLRMTEDVAAEIIVPIIDFLFCLDTAAGKNKIA